MSRLEQRIGRLEATKVDRPGTSGTPEECCARFGYTLDQAITEFGSFPPFCYAMMTRPDPNYIPSGRNAYEAYRAMCR